MSPVLRFMPARRVETGEWCLAEGKGVQTGAERTEDRIKCVMGQTAELYRKVSRSRKKAAERGRAGSFGIGGAWQQRNHPPF